MSAPATADLLELLIEQSVLRFGEFTLKSGRQSPYFFNLGAINSGAAIARLGEAYADGAERLGLPFDSVFGPAYKGIPIAVATASSLAARGRDCGWVFNRKEAKGHGEGGQATRTLHHLLSQEQYFPTNRASISKTRHSSFLHHGTWQHAGHQGIIQGWARCRACVSLAGINRTRRRIAGRDRDSR